MTPIAPHITAFLQQRLPIERRASDNTCESYAYAFKLLFEYASGCLKISPSQLHLEQIDSMQTTEMYTRADPSVKLEALESIVAPKLRTGRFKATDKLIAVLKMQSVMRRDKP